MTNTGTATVTVSERFPEYGRVIWTARQGRTVVAQVESTMEMGSFDSDVLRQAVATHFGIASANAWQAVRYERKRSDRAAIVPRLRHVTLPRRSPCALPATYV
jgi:hypothetical protein